MANEFADEESSSIDENTLTRETTPLDQIKFDEAKEVFNRKKIMYWVSLCLIILTIFLIIAIISAVVICMGFKLDELDKLSQIWHIYLISLVALSTMLSGMIFLNKSTWSNKADNDKPIDLALLVDKFSQIFKK